MHEYGHYIVWTYDDLSSNCVQGEDEGSAVNETLAEIFSGFFARVNRKIDARYGAYSGTGTDPHTGPDTVLLHDINCAGGDNYGHDLGGAFEQAVWELLFNRDCSIDACSRDTRTNGNRIWRRASRDDVQRHVGAALGYALNVLGQNVTHQQVAAQMLEKISSDSGRETKNRARAVFIHHGVL